MPRPRISSELRERVVSRAQARCEYCRIPEVACFAALEIDHIIAEQHGGLTQPENLALACLSCNKRKGPNIASLDPESGTLTPLFNPRRDHWSVHFDHEPDGRIRGRTDVGRATAQLLVLNSPDRIEERRLLIAAGMWNPS